MRDDIQKLVEEQIAALAQEFDVFIITAIATLSAFLYNMSAALLGGVELTLAEDER